MKISRRWLFLGLGLGSLVGGPTQAPAQSKVESSPAPVAEANRIFLTQFASQFPDVLVGPGRKTKGRYFSQLPPILPSDDPVEIRESRAILAYLRDRFEAYRSANPRPEYLLGVPGGEKVQDDLVRILAASPTQATGQMGLFRRLLFLSGLLASGRLSQERWEDLRPQAIQIFHRSTRAEKSRQIDSIFQEMSQRLTPSDPTTPEPDPPEQESTSGGFDPILAGLGLLGLAAAGWGGMSWTRKRAEEPEATPPRKNEPSPESTRPEAPSSPPSPPPEKGQVSERYELREILGEGGMGRVYRAHDRVMDRAVAIKIMTAQGSQNDEVRRRFRREAEVLASLGHPGIVQIHDILDTPSPGIVMEAIQGISLDRYLEVWGPLEARATLALGLQILEPLDFVHQKGCIHRDLKPQNLMLSTQGQLKLLDFGLARSEHLTAITAHDQALGTWSYMSPEQLQGLPVDPSSDLYSVATILYLAVTGRHPYQGQDFLTRTTKLPPAPSQIRADLPRCLDEALLRGLSPQASSRPKSARAWSDELKSCLGRLDAAVPPGARIPLEQAVGGIRRSLPQVEISIPKQSSWVDDGLALQNFLIDLEGLFEIPRQRISRPPIRVSIQAHHLTFELPFRSLPEDQEASAILRQNLGPGAQWIESPEGTPEVRFRIQGAPGT